MTDTREKVRKALKQFIDDPVRDMLVDDLVALIDEARGEKVWCKHWKWKQSNKTGEEPGYFVKASYDWLAADDAWDICPVKDCHAKKPK